MGVTSPQRQEMEWPSFEERVWIFIFMHRLYAWCPKLQSFRKSV